MSDPTTAPNEAEPSHSEHNRPQHDPEALAGEEFDADAPTQASESLLAAQTAQDAEDTPEAEKTEDLRTRVQWTRPGDLAARAGAVILEKSSDLHQRGHELARQAVLEATRTGQDRIRRFLAQRAEDLTPQAAAPVSRPTAGRQEVSR